MACSTGQTTVQAHAPVLWWVRRDMRLDDNPAMLAALRTGAPLVPVFVWSPEDDGQFQQGRYSRWWTKHSVVQFQKVLQQAGSRLIIRRASETTKGLLQVVQETKATAVFFNTLYDPISLVRDHEVKRALAKINVPCYNFNADVLYEPWEVLDSNKQPYTNFQAFWQGVLAMPTPPALPLPAPTALPHVDPELFSVEVKELDWFMTPEQEASSDLLKFKWKPGIEGALEKLEAFLGDRLPVYHHDRAKVDRASTSQLSPWLHCGTLSVRYLFYRVCARQTDMALRGVSNASESARHFLQQVGYREYSRYLTFHFPFIHERTLLAHLRACPWRMDQQHFKAWRQGQTGYPLIDAAMRELWSTGWTHNRMRVVCASFMVKNLLLPWQWGLKHFWDAQMDADLECDALGWQYVAGGMTDAKPFSYMIDLEAEAKRFDPDGEFVRRWLPVLARLPTEYIHAPWKAPPQVLAIADVELGYTYPERIITQEESLTNLTQACQVLDLAAAPSSSLSGSHPYRPPTLPASALNALKIGSGSGQPGTGTGTGYNVNNNPGDQQPAANTGSNEAPQGNPQQARAVRNRGPPRDMQPAEEAASQMVRPQLTKAERAQLRQERQRGQRGVPGAVAQGQVHEWDLRGAGGGDDGRVRSGLHGADSMEGVEGGEREVRAAPGRPGAWAELQSSSGSSDVDWSEDEAMSEEVVSNTVGLSAPQVSGLSVLGRESSPAAVASRDRPPVVAETPQQHRGHRAQRQRREAVAVEAGLVFEASPPAQLPQPQQSQGQGPTQWPTGNVLNQAQESEMLVQPPSQTLVGGAAAAPGCQPQQAQPAHAAARDVPRLGQLHRWNGSQQGQTSGEGVQSVACHYQPAGGWRQLDQQPGSSGAASGTGYQPQRQTAAQPAPVAARAPQPPHAPHQPGQPFVLPSQYQSDADKEAQATRPADPFQFAAEHKPQLLQAQRELLQERHLQQGQEVAAQALANLPLGVAQKRGRSFTPAAEGGGSTNPSTNVSEDAAWH